jgi:hypothetical protein
MAALIVVALATIWSGMSQAEDVYTHARFDLHITNVRSIAPEKRAGFSKTWEVYSVTAHGNVFDLSAPVPAGQPIPERQMSYVLYCTHSAPETGRVYTAREAYISSGYSALHLWPVEKNNLDLPADTKNKKGRLYKVIIIENVAPNPKPDLACDIYSEQAR